MRAAFYRLLDAAAPLGPRGDAGVLRAAFDALDLRRHGGLALVDIGAAGALPPRFAPVVDSLAYTGFEPDDRSRSALLDADPGCLSYTIRPEAIGTGEPITLHLLEEAVFSSPFPPDRERLGRYPHPERFATSATVEMPTAPLDALGLEACHFIKVDIQGGELAALKGADTLLEGCFGVESEVEFTALYHGQPLFADMQEHLTSRGFEFVDFVTLGRWSRDRDDRLGQCLYGDALFLRPPERVLAAGPTPGEFAAYLGVLSAYRRYDWIRTTLATLPGDDPLHGDFARATSRGARRQARLAAIPRAALRAAGGDQPGYRAHLFY